MGFPYLVVELHCDWDSDSGITSAQLFEDVKIVWNKPPSYEVYYPKEINEKSIKAVVPPGSEGEKAYVFLINNTHVLSSTALFIYVGHITLNEKYSVTVEDAQNLL
jgi:hypothetical protein